VILTDPMKEVSPTTCNTELLLKILVPIPTCGIPLVFCWNVAIGFKLFNATELFNILNWLLNDEIMYLSILLELLVAVELIKDIRASG
jgi:hypothetical protein